MRVLLFLACAAPLAGCGRSDTPPPLTGNLSDARGAHAGSFRSPDAGPGDYGNAARPIHAAQGSAAAEHVRPDPAGARQ